MLFFIINILLLFFFSLNLILSKNTIYSIFSLIIIFFLSAILLIQFGLDYIPLIFISIYVGALSVLFLFVIMMLDSKIFNKTSNYLFYFSFFFISLLFISLIFFHLTFKLNFLPVVVESYADILIKNNPIFTIGFLIFTKYFMALSISGIILFIAMLGSVSLVLQPYKSIKHQVLYRQISRDSRKTFFKVL